MRALLFAAALLAGSCQVFAADAGLSAGWRRLLAAVGLDAAPPAVPFQIVEGESAAAQALGFRPTSRTVRVASLVDARDPQLEILWERPLELPVYELPEGARVFTREKWTGAPLVAGLGQPGRAALWTAVDIGEKGYERFPYLLQALADLGVEFPFRGARTWAFFDYSYRLRADPDFLARRWRAAGIAAMHVAAWHFYDADPWRDQYLKQLIEACHRQGILIYAWIELPHVSEAFWDQHPQWREKTAILQDAHLDWRKLMNLADPECSKAVEAGVRALLGRFDWDGVNVAELYFESLYGPSDPQRFTPLNATVRQEFRQQAGFDPLELFRRESGHYWEKDRQGWTRFVDYRAGLARRLQSHWLESVRKWKPELDLTLTHIDDRFDTRMREFLGADAAAVLPLLDRLDFTFIVEDPATTWHLGPERYPEIASRYAALAGGQQSLWPRLAVDINIVERYQQVYPTKKQTGGEFAQLIQMAGRSFSRVVLYFEQSVAPVDYEILAAASAAGTRAERSETGLLVEADRAAGVRWKGSLKLDGRPWPATDGETAWIPAGRHLLESGPAATPLRLLYLNAELLDARALEDGIEFAYQSPARAAALVDRRPSRILVDGRALQPPVLEAGQHTSLLLPPGKRTVRLIQ